MPHFSQAAKSLDSTKASAGRETGNTGVSGSRSNILATEVGQKIGVAAWKCARAAKAVDLAYMAEVRWADGVGSGARAREELTSEARCLEWCSYILEDVAFSDDLAASTDFEGVSGVIVPVVVDGVEKGVSADLGGTTRGLINVVVLESNGLFKLASY